MCWISKLSSLLALCFLLCACRLVTTAKAPIEDILIDDFEEGFDNWQVEGNAFGERPVYQRLPQQKHVWGNLGGTYANSHNAGEDSTGKLTSPPFTIVRRYINFLIGGGGFEGETCMNLLMDGKVVRTATGPNTKEGGTEELEWKTWEVSEFAGKETRIEIVDNRKGLWGHINVDHIYQSDAKVEIVEGLTREFSLTKKYLNLPVQYDSDRQVLSLEIDGKKVREIFMRVAGGQPDYWAYLELDEFEGTNAVLRADKLKRSQIQGFEAIYQDDTFPGQENLYKEKLRPQFHYSPKRGTISDPHGMVYYDGEYHIFYQHNPFGMNSAFNRTWGHAVSTDLVHWKELGDALHPERRGQIVTGSGVVDHKNTTGFQTGEEPPLVFIYSSGGGETPWSHDQPWTQMLAYSNNRARTFTVYEGNPVLGHVEGTGLVRPLGAHDPKVFWHKPTNQWVIVLYHTDFRMAFYTSRDLKSWELKSEINGRQQWPGVVAKENNPHWQDDWIFHEVPEFFELPVDGDKNNTKWVFYSVGGHYFLCDFDGKTCTPTSEILWLSHGNCNWASQTISNIPPEDGRRIQIGWGMGVDATGMPFNDMLTFPIELTLRTTDEGVRMFAYPAKEIESIHAKEYTWTDVQLKPGQNILSNIAGELFDIEAQFEVGDADELGFILNGVSLVYNVDDNKLSCEDWDAKLKPVDGKIRMRILVDRLSIEAFANDGRVYMPISSETPEESEKGLEIFTKGGKTKVNSLKIHKLKSIWN